MGRPRPTGHPLHDALPVEPGDTGAQGPTGATGAQGTACWDLNGDGECTIDLTNAERNEDKNGDGSCTAADCTGPERSEEGRVGKEGGGGWGPEDAQGEAGWQGPEGEEGPVGRQGATGSQGDGGGPGDRGAQR